MATRIAGFVYTLSTGLAAGGVTVTPRASDGSVGTTDVTNANGFIAIAGLADKIWVGTVASATQVFSPCTIAEQIVTDDLHGQSNTLSAHDFSQLRGKVVATQVNSQAAALNKVLTADGAGNSTWETGGGAVTSVTAADATLTISPTTGAVVAARAAITGDATIAAGSNASVLATVNANVGSFGTATQVSAITVNGKGLVTAAANTTIAVTSTAVTDFTEAAQDAVGAMVDASLTYVDATPLLQRAALTGDVTASAGLNSTTIAADVVTVAKMHASATDVFFGRDTAAAGPGEEITVAAAKTLLSLTGTNSGDQTITLTGDVTGSGTGSFAATIANAAVTLAKMANLAQDQFIGRVTASTGVPETATITAAARTTLDDTTVAAMVNTLGGATSTGTGGLVRATEPSLVSPFIGDLTNMNHSHLNAGQGGVLDVAAIASGTFSVARGGTGAATLTGLLQGNGTSAITGVTNSSTVGQILRVTGASTYAWGALDLADTDAVTGVLPIGNAASSLATATITFIVDGNGSAITTGIKGDLEIPFACTINRATLLANESGSVVVDIFKSTYANFDPPTTPASGDKITASAPPTITAAKKSQDSTLTGWTTSIAAGDVLRFNVNSVTTITRCTLSLKVTKT